MFCRNCGMEIPAGAVFCPGCGTKVEAQPAAQAYQVPSYEAPAANTPDPDGTVLLGGAAYAGGASMQGTGWGSAPSAVDSAWDRVPQEKAAPAPGAFSGVQPRTNYPGQQVFSAVPPAEGLKRGKELKYTGGQFGQTPFEQEEKRASVPGWLYPVLGIIIGVLAAILIWQII